MTTSKIHTKLKSNKIDFGFDCPLDQQILELVLCIYSDFDDSEIPIGLSKEGAVAEQLLIEINSKKKGNSKFTLDEIFLLIEMAITENDNRKLLS